MSEPVVGSVTPNNETRLENTETGPTVFFWDQRREPAAFGERLDEFLRVAKLTVEFLPILAGKIGDDLTDRVTDLLLLDAQAEVHGRSEYSMASVGVKRL